MSSAQRFRHALLATGIIIGLAACNGDGSSDDGDPTPTRTTQPTAAATPTTQPTATRTPLEGALVSGLVVVNSSVSGRTDDRLGVPPAAWMAEADNAAFDAALGFADWALAEDDSITGTTAADGQFLIAGLPAGRYTLVVTKTLDGNLLIARVPFTAGDDGATVVAEVAWGQVRSVSTYEQDGVTVREVRDPSGRWLITHDGRVVELGTGGATYSDPDGDGSFETTPCIQNLWLCDAHEECGPDRTCGCIASCPGCEDCGVRACQPIGASPYRCSGEIGRTCQDASESCVCVPSCPDCDDCAATACVADCQSVEFTSLSISGSTELVVGQAGYVYALATLSNGQSMDVTTLVTWSSSDIDVASVDAFGAIATHSIGTTTVRASLGDLDSNDWTVNVVTRPALRQIYLQNVSCYYPLGDPVLRPGERPPVLDAAPIADDVWWPHCNQIVRIGATIRFQAMGEFGNGVYYEDITDEVTFTLTPAGIGSMDGGVFTAEAEGTTMLTASLGTVTSDTAEIRVVTKSTVTMLSIYANQGPIIIDDRPVPIPGVEGAAAEIAPCFGCGYIIPVLRGDELNFNATAHYDTGEWVDVTDEVTWRSSDASIASIDDAGTMLAVNAGTALIDATFEQVTSNPVTTNVVNEATLQYIYLQAEGSDRVIVKGGQLFLRASGGYDIGIQRDITGEVTWRSSNASVGTVNSAGIFSALAAGITQVWAESGALRSEPLSLEVYETSDVTYCDSGNVNRGLWSDDFNRVVLESDCATYTRPGVVTLRYTVTETQPHGGIFDPCLDLYVYQGNSRIRTLREEGCGEPFLPSAAPDYADEVLKYQLRAFWDLKDESGETVGPGTYTVYGRFYLYYDPVVSIDVAVE